MADGATTNYNWVLPEVGASADSWGSKTNSNWDSVDADLHAVSAAQGNYLPLTGGSLSGPLYVAAPGINYGGHTNYIAFGWDGNIQGFVDNTYIGEMATQAWANGTFATYGWVNGNFYPAGTTDGRYLYKGGDTCTGNLRINGEMSCNDIQNSSGVFYVANTSNYYLQRNSSDGHWRWVEGGNITMDLDPAGNITHPGSCTAAAHTATGRGVFYNGCFATSDQSFGMFVNASGDKTIQFTGGSPAFHFSLINATGDLRWYGTGNLAMFTYRYADAFCFANQSAVGGFGAYQNLSDARSKQHIEPTGKGLAAILQLNPVSFHRIGLDGNVRDRQEIGLIAQDVQRVIPEAVAEMGIELTADGLGGKDTAAPSLGLECDPLIAVLVNAVKELTARLAALEGAARA